MPLLDVSIALTSPYLTDQFVVQRRQDIVGLNGRTSPYIVQFNNVVGIVRPSGDNSLKRERDSQTQCKSLKVTTIFTLRGASLSGQAQSWQPDLVLWHGDSFVVKDCQDNTNFGQGFVKAECENEGVVPTPPAGVNIMLPADAQLYIPTMVTPSVFTLPAALNTPRLLWFRDGIMITQQNNDFIPSTSGGLLTIILTVPLQMKESLIAYA